MRSPTRLLASSASSARLALLSGLTLASFLSGAALARADEANCPPGSSQKTESGFAWCEPSVCETDTNCKTGEVCRPAPLCVEIGKLTGDAGQRLMVRQRCGADRSCPQNTTCSDMKRCMSRSDADKLAPPAPSAAPSEPANKSCACRAAGASTSSRGPLLLTAMALSVLLRRRR